MDRMTMNEKCDELMNPKPVYGMNDSDANIMAELRHEACEGHCPDCEHCFEYGEETTECDWCGWEEDLSRPTDDPHEGLEAPFWTRCDCDTCAEDRAEHRARFA